MTKINSFSDLKKKKEEILSKEVSNIIHVKIAMATCGIASGAKTVMSTIKDKLEKSNIKASVTQVGCMGYCYAEPTVEVAMPGKEPVVFGFVDTKKAEEIVEKYIKNNEMVEGVIPVNYQTVDKK